MATEQEKTEELLLDFISYLLIEETICEDDARIFQLQAENYSKGVIEPIEQLVIEAKEYIKSKNL